MQQLSKNCIIGGHESKQIEFACIFPQCNQSRFLCSKCLKNGNHKHQQYDQTHILDPEELFDQIQQKIKKIDIKLKASPVKGLILEIQSQIQKMAYFIENLEKGILQNQGDRQFNLSLMKLKNTGFDQFDEKDLDNLLKIDYKVCDIYNQLSEQSNPIIQNLIRIQESCFSQEIDDSELFQKLKDAKYQLTTQDQLRGDCVIQSSAISNDYKYIASGGTDKILKIWDYEYNSLIKSIQFDGYINCIKFTKASKWLYVANSTYLYQLNVENQFNVTYQQAIHKWAILNIYCITDSIILTSSSDHTIIKTDTNLKQQLFVIIAHNNQILGLDYNMNVSMIVSASNDQSIKLWNGTNGQLILEKQNAHDFDYIVQVLFINKKNQLISLDNWQKIKIWNINFEAKQLEQTQMIIKAEGIFNISLILDQQFITLVGKDSIQIYSINGDHVRTINHDVQDIWYFNTIQPSMKALIVQGQQTLLICKMD